MAKITNRSVATNFIWRFAERTGAKMVSFVVSMILARILAPEHYGTIALVTVITHILQVFVDSGMGNALIQKKDADELDFSTVFYFNIFLCGILYTGVFVFAPLIAKFYNDITLIPVIRVLSLTIVISGVKNVQQAYVSRTMQFKRFFFATLGGTIGAAVMGIAMAYMGFGVWALVSQQLFNVTIDTIVLWMTVKWRPRKQFSFQRLKGLYSFGWKLLVSSLLETVYQNMRQLIIGKIYSTENLAYYNRGSQFPSLIITNINSSIDSVLMPALSNEQDNVEKVRNMTRRSVKTSIYIIAPLMIGLAACGTPLVRLLLTEKWLPAVPYLRIFCISFMLYPVHTTNLNAIKSMGKSDIYLRMEIVKKVIDVVLLLATMWHSVMAMAYSLLISDVISLYINCNPNKKLINYGFFDQLKDILPGILLTIIMGVCVSMVEVLGLPDILTLMIQVAVGAAIYIGVSTLLKLDSFMYIWNMIKCFGKRKG